MPNKVFDFAPLLPYLRIIIPLLVGAIAITAAAFHRRHDETPGGGNFFANVLWLVLGGGLPLAMLLCLLGLVLRILPWTRDIGRSLRAATLYVAAPAEYRMRRTRRYKPLPMHFAWMALLGLWLGLAEAAVGIAYCCTVLGISFGRQHLALARFFVLPCAHRFMTLAEYEDYLSDHLHAGR